MLELEFVGIPYFSSDKYPTVFFAVSVYIWASFAE